MLEPEKDSAIPKYGNAKSSGYKKPDVKTPNAFAGMNAKSIAGITTR